MTETAIGYTRLSQQSDTSLERQERHIREYARERGFELVDVLSDGEGASGFDADERPAYREVVDRVREGDLAAVITNDKRRLTRDVDEAMRLLPEFRESDTELHTYQDGPLDLSDPIRAAIEIVSAAAAFEEKQQEIAKAREATRERVEDPDIDHGRPRFGMRYDESGTTQVPGENFDDVLEVLRLESKGLTYREIESITGVPSSTAQTIVQRREWYVERDKLSEAERR